MTTDFTGPKLLDQKQAAAYLGTTDSQRIAEAERRLTAFASAKIPYMVDMVNHGRLPDEAYDSLIEFFGIK